jgi:hypothetical protein
MQAIETVYKGYRFRSRLEARWAVFFDMLGVLWQYEVEGLILSNGRKYLPDFWLPIHQLYWEVKPEGSDLHGIGCSLFRGCEEHEQVGVAELPLVFVSGPPWSYETDDWGFHGNGQEGRWAHCPTCNHIDFVYAGWAGYINGCHCHDGPSKAYKFDGTSTTTMLTAITASKQSRFEYGENGRPVSGLAS